MTNPKGLEGCMRCPDCKLAPEPKLTKYADGADAWELRCEQHGHVAMGDDVDQAVKHWNIYIWHKLTGEVLG